MKTIYFLTIVFISFHLHSMAQPPNDSGVIFDKPHDEPVVNKYPKGGTDYFKDWYDGNTVEKFRLKENLGSGNNYMYFTTRVEQDHIPNCGPPSPFGYEDARFYVDPNTVSNISLGDITLYLHEYAGSNGFDESTDSYWGSIQLSGSNHDWELAETNYSGWGHSNPANHPYLTARVKIPVSMPQCGISTQFKIAFQKDPCFGGWQDEESAFLKTTIHTSNTFGSLNGYYPSGIWRTFDYSEAIALDLSGSTCESKYTIEIVETYSNGQPIYENGTSNWLNGSSNTVAGQGPSNINIRQWTGGNSEPIVQESENLKYYRMMIATYPSWDSKWFFFKVSPVDCQHLYLDKPEHVYDGLSDAAEALNNSFQPHYLSDPDNYLPANWDIIKMNNLSVPSQANIYFTYGGALCRLTFGPNDVGSQFKLVLTTTCPHNQAQPLIMQKTFVVEDYGSGLILDPNPDIPVQYKMTSDNEGLKASPEAEGKIFNKSIRPKAVINNIENDKFILKPNPVAVGSLAKLTLLGVNGTSGDIRIDIFSLDGNMISSEKYSGGTNKRLLRTPNLASGLYVIHVYDLISGKMIESKKLVVIK